MALHLAQDPPVLVRRKPHAVFVDPLLIGGTRKPSRGIAFGWSGAPARLPSWVPIPGLALDRPQAQEYGDRSSDHIPVLLFTLEFIYGLDSPTPYPLRELPHNLIWFSITPILACSRRDRGRIDLAGRIWEVV